MVLEQPGAKPKGTYIWHADTMTYENVKTGEIIDQDEALYALTEFVKAYGKA
jgi:hypothetical protein